MIYAPDPFYGDYDPPLPTCGVCGDEFEPWTDSYCGREFTETEFCQRCAHDDGKPDPLGGWNEDVLRDR